MITDKDIEKRLRDECAVQTGTRLSVDLLATIQSLIREAMPSRNRVDAIICAPISMTNKINAIMQLFQEEREPWCKHIKQATYRIWILNDESISGQEVYDDWTVCPICGKPRPEGE